MKEKNPGNSNTDIRPFFYRRLVFIAISLLGIILLNQDEVLTLIFVLVGVANIVYLIIFEKQIYESFFPSKEEPTEASKSFNELMFYAASSLFFIGFVAFIFNMKGFYNIIGGLGIVWKGILLGLIISTALLFMARANSPTIFDNRDSRYVLLGGLPLGIIGIYI